MQHLMFGNSHSYKMLNYILYGGMASVSEYKNTDKRQSYWHLGTFIWESFLIIKKPSSWKCFQEGIWWGPSVLSGNGKQRSSSSAPRYFVFTAPTVFLVELLYHLPLTALLIFKFLTIFTWVLPWQRKNGRTAMETLKAIPNFRVGRHHVVHVTL